jgi:hypothetical protein
MPLDRNPNSPKRWQRNWQRLRDGSGTANIQTVAPILNTGSAIQLTLAAPSGLTVNSGALTISLAATSGLNLTSGLAVGAGAGISVLANTVAVSLNATSGLNTAAGLQVTAGNGIILTSNAVTVRLNATPALEFVTGAMQVQVNATGGITRSGTGLTLPLTTKGDILTFSTTTVRLPVGANGFVLAANSATATGLEWVAGGGGGGGTFRDNEIPTGLINGVNATFTLAFTPIVGSLILNVNGVIQRLGATDDYTLTAATITFLAGAIPTTGEEIRAWYRS